MKVYGGLEVAQLEWFTDAGKPAASSYPYRVIWVTDKKQVQVSDGTNWMQGVINVYTDAGLPAAGASNANTIAFISDTGKLKVSTGSVWTNIGGVIDSYTSGTIPSAAANLNKIIWVSDNTQFQFSDGSTWTAAAAASQNLINVVPGVASYAILSTDNVILTNAAVTTTITLPTAVGRTGKIYQLVKTDSSLTKITIATTSSQTIGAPGTTTKKLCTQGEAFYVESDGANWQIIGRVIPSVWTSYSGTISAVSVNPTLPTAAVTTWWYRRVADSMEIMFTYATPNSTGGVTGTGGYRFPLPTGATVDVNKLITVQETGFTNGAGANIVGNSYITNDTSSPAAFGGCQGWVQVYSANDVWIQHFYSSGATGVQTWGSGTSRPIGDPGVAMYCSFNARVPITDWEG